MALVLVVDDSAMDRKLAQSILEKNPDLSVETVGDGAEALQFFQRQVPDLVVTDLQMPEMDGLELVGVIRSKFPLVPVVLMTAHGSEEIAVQALQRGASSYVPKSKLADELPDTIDAVLGVARADRQHDRLLECLARSESVFRLENDSALVYPLVDHLQQIIGRMKLCDATGRIRVGIALEEALLNALYHGNLELSSEALRESRANLLSSGRPSQIDERRARSPYRERRIEVHAAISPEVARVVIRDEGPGFDPALVPDCTDPANLERDSGRGLLLMRTFMDEVIFNDKGNEVTLVKRREARQ